MKFKTDFPPVENREDKVEDLITDKVLEIDFNDLNKEKFQELYFSLQESEPPVLNEEKIVKLLEHALSQYPEDYKDTYSDKDSRLKNELLWSILDYISNFKEINKQTNESTLDRSFRTLFNLAEKYPVGVYESMTRTHHLFEFVKPEIFYETLVKIQNNKELNKLYSSHLFSQLEYNISYCGTEKYVNALINKIDFKNAKSCSESGHLMNFAVHLADYANSGSYSGNYNVGNEIITALKEGAKDRDSVYLLSSKAEYITKRMEKRLPPLVHQNSIFKPTENVIAKYEDNTLYIQDMNDTLNREVSNYESVTKEINMPPKGLIEQAKAKGQNFIEWSPSTDLIRLQKKLSLEIKQKMRPVNSSDLSPSPNVTISQDDIKEYAFLIGSDFRNFIEEDFGISLSKLSIREQYYLFTFFQKQTNESIKGVKEFSKKFHENGLKTFFSIAYGGKEMGEKILSLGEKLPEDVANKVFVKYSDIINTVNNSEEEIKKIFGDKEVPVKVISSVKETLLKRGAKMLSELGDKVVNPKFVVNEEEILKELDEIKEETIILGESYVGLYKEGIRVPIEDVTTIKETPTEKLTEKEKKELVKIYEKGRPKVTYDKKGHLEFLKKEFEEELNDKDVSVTEICFKDETLIIALVDRKNTDSLYIGGLTFVEDVKNAVVAEASMSYVLEKFKDHNIKALVDSRNPILRMYMNRFGFRITKKLESEEEIKNNGGEIYYEIERPKDNKIVERQQLGNVA